MYLVISLFGFEGRMWDLIVSVPDHCLSFYLTITDDDILQQLGVDSEIVYTLDNLDLLKRFDIDVKWVSK